MPKDKTESNIRIRSVAKDEFLEKGRITDRGTHNETV